VLKVKLRMGAVRGRPFRIRSITPEFVLPNRAFLRT